MPPFGPDLRAWARVGLLTIPRTIFDFDKTGCQRGFGINLPAIQITILVGHCVAAEN